MSWQIGSLKLRLHPLLPLFALLVTVAGDGSACLLVFACVLMHEMGHLFAARMACVCADELTLMPMGGELHISGLYRLPRRKIIFIATAGPAASLLLAFAGVFLPQFVPIRFVLVNLALCAFNLLPALPMDGGRILAAMLSAKIGCSRAVRIAAIAGRVFGAILLAVAIICWIASGKILLSAAVTAIYVIACAGSEQDTCELSCAEDLCRLMTVNRTLEPLPLQMIRCEKEIEPDQLMRLLRPDRCTVIEWTDTNEWESDRAWLIRQIRS